MDTDHDPENEDTFAQKIKHLEDKIIKKRNKHKSGWKEKLVNEKICLKFVKKFHVNIFEDPVEALLNIDYKPNLNNFHTPM